jgi:DNA-directed RNA polymerase subunit RPC12/RpoP
MILNIRKFADALYSTDITCPVCGFDVDLWTCDEAICHICGYKIFQKEKTTH